VTLPPAAVKAQAAPLRELLSSVRADNHLLRMRVVALEAADTRSQDRMQTLEGWEEKNQLHFRNMVFAAAISGDMPMVGRCRLTVSKPVLAHGFTRLQLEYNKLFSTFAFNFNLSHYTMVSALLGDGDSATSLPVDVVHSGSSGVTLLNAAWPSHKHFLQLAFLASYP